VELQREDKKLKQIENYKIELRNLQEKYDHREKELEEEIQLKDEKN